MLKEGLRKANLRALAGADVRKVALAERMWAKTTAPQGWIAPSPSAAEKLAVRSASKCESITAKKVIAIQPAFPAAQNHLGEALFQQDAGNKTSVASIPVCRAWPVLVKI